LLELISVTVDDLSPGTGYCEELVAENGSGTGRGGQVKFTTTAIHALTISPAVAPVMAPPSPSVTEPQPINLAECRVPKLHARSLTSARRALRRVHCVLGKVTRPTRHRGHLVVVAQSIHAGRAVPDGTPVALKLGPAVPKATHRH
jgi:hypothetical protein